MHYGLKGQSSHAGFSNYTNMRGSGPTSQINEAISNHLPTISDQASNLKQVHFENIESSPDADMNVGFDKRPSAQDRKFKMYSKESADAAAKALGLYPREKPLKMTNWQRKALIVARKNLQKAPNSLKRSSLSPGNIRNIDIPA